MCCCTEDLTPVENGSLKQMWTRIENSKTKLVKVLLNHIYSIYLSRMNMFRRVVEAQCLQIRPFWALYLNQANSFMGGKLRTPFYLRKSEICHGTAVTTKYTLSIQWTNRLQEMEKKGCQCDSSIFVWLWQPSPVRAFCKCKAVFTYHFLQVNCVLLQGARAHRQRHASFSSKRPQQQFTKCCDLLENVFLIVFSDLY